jgi:hypothetical protein
LPLKDDLLKQLDGIVEGKVKVDGLLLLRYYHIFFYLCSSFLLFAGANAKPDRIGLGESLRVLFHFPFLFGI